jgi:methionyl-tRNA formyltransferase
VPQAADGVCWAPKIGREDGHVDFAQPATALDRRVRAMSPWPGGWADTQHGVLKLKAVRLADGAGPPGTVLSLSPLVVACGEGTLELVTVQAAGRRPVAGADYAHGAHLTAGGPL